MAETEIHKSKRKKNLVVLALVLGWCLLIFLISITRMARAEEPGDMMLAPGIMAGPAEMLAPGLFEPDLPGGAFLDGRTAHRARMDEHPARWHAARAAGEAERAQNDAAREAAGAAHRARIDEAREERFQIWRDGEGARQEKDAAREQAGAAHRENMAGRPAAWWRERLNP